MYQVRKVSNEGSSSPFIARLFIGMLRFRDQLYLLSIEQQDRDEMRNRFDRKFKPMFEAAQAARDAAIEIANLISAHAAAVESGKAVRFDGNSCNILETIDIPLSQAVDKFIDQTIIALKTGLQGILREILGLDIGFLFQNDKDFSKGLASLQKPQEDALRKYLEHTRQSWLSDLQELRIEHEHKGWCLEHVKYKQVAPSRMVIDLPTIEGLPVNEYACNTVNNVLLFIETMMVYAMQRMCTAPIFVTEIPEQQRNPADPQRFMLVPGNRGPKPAWIITRSDSLDFMKEQSSGQRRTA